jgi:hypothetical protein
MQQVRELIFYRHYFREFFDRQTEKVKEKIDFVLFVLTHADRVPEKFLSTWKDKKDFTKSGLRQVTIFFGFSVALTKEKS